MCGSSTTQVNGTECMCANFFAIVCKLLRIRASIFRSPGLLLDPRPIADVGRILILYLLSKKTHVFVARAADVLGQRCTTIARTHENDFLFTSLDDGQSSSNRIRWEKQTIDCVLSMYWLILRPC